MLAAAQRCEPRRPCALGAAMRARCTLRGSAQYACSRDRVQRARQHARVCAPAYLLAPALTVRRYVKFDTFHPAVERGLPVTRVISRVKLQEILARAATRCAT